MFSFLNYSCFQTLVLGLLVVSIVIVAYKCNARRLRDNLRRRQELNQRRREIILPDYGPTRERVTLNPLYDASQEDR